MGLPSLIMVIAENQREIANGLDQFGAALNLGWFEQAVQRKIAISLTELLEDTARRQRMSKVAQTLIDGWGSYRVAEATHYLQVN
jgi:spore coat polysaccharide biosynthesis predicted glycosyltransferase SpsG